MTPPPPPAPYTEQVPPQIQELKEEVEAFATQFPTIGFEKADMRYKD